MNKQCPKCNGTKWTKKIWTEVCSNARCRFTLPYNLKDLVEVEWEHCNRGIDLIKKALKEMK